MHPQLLRFITQFDLASAVHLAGMQTDMPAVLNELDVLVSASRSEAMPLAVMEAMASGVPVVATRVGGIPDLVQHGVTGWLADNGDYEGLASRVIDLLRDEAMRVQAGMQARRRALERFDLTEGASATAALLSRLAQGRADSRRIGAISAETHLVSANSAEPKAGLG